MARGNIVDSVTFVNKFGLLILTPRSKTQTFTQYRYFKISTSGTLIGEWGMDSCQFGAFTMKAFSYKDYLTRGMTGYKLLKRTEKYLFFRKYSPAQ